LNQLQEEGKELFTPCEESDGGAIKMTFIDVPRGKLKAPVVRREDIFAVLQDVKASVSQEEIKRCVEWTEQFGSEGA
jgi:vacuolar protein-sorting-associated protein 4